MERKENLTKEYIYGAFMRLLEKKSYDKITVCEITQVAGVSRMSFYRNFNSKDDLIIKGFEEILANVHEKINAYHNVSIYAIALVLFSEMKKYKNIFPSIENSEISKSLVEITTKKLKADLPNDYISKAQKYVPVFYLGAMATTLLEWLKDGAEESPEEMARMVASLVNTDVENQPLQTKIAW